MNLFGLSLTRTKGILPQTLSPVSGNGGWFGVIREAFTGAWQRNIEVSTESVLTFSAVYACVTLIASDIAKIPLNLVEIDKDGIWNETDNPAFSPVLRKPNHYQTRIKFIEQWVTSKLIHGNTYVLKQRDERQIVTGLYVLNPQRVQVQVAETGDIYYAVQYDNLTPMAETDLVFPASEIIHDVMVPLYHPLCGVSPLTACHLAAAQGLNILSNSAKFFGKGQQASGVLTAPGVINQATADRIKKFWDDQVSGANYGGVAVLGDGLKYEPMAMTAVDSQLIEQLKLSAENVCTAYHVPPYMIGVGSAPSYNNIEALNQQYYQQCLQVLIESIEALLDEGLGLQKPKERQRLGTEFDLDSLLRMDTSSRMDAGTKAIRAGMSPNETRFKFYGLGPVKGGETPFMQQQDWPLALLAQKATSEALAMAGAPRATPDDAPTDKSLLTFKAKWLAAKKLDQRVPVRQQQVA